MRALSTIAMRVGRFNFLFYLDLQGRPGRGGGVALSILSCSLILVSSIFLKSHGKRQIKNLSRLPPIPMAYVCWSLDDPLVLGSSWARAYV